MFDSIDEIGQSIEWNIKLEKPKLKPLRPEPLNP
jgi:hypothetical protein